MANHLLLKWGTLKGWDFSDNLNPKIMKLLERYHEIGACMSVAMQEDTPEQKQIICDIIDLHEGTITNDWSGETMSKKVAKKYVMEYGKNG